MPELDQNKFYEPVGCCIYCGAPGHTVKLGKEHIIPAGLGGRLILPEASCPRCSHITGATIERQCLRRMLGSLRLRLGLSGRRKKKERPETLPAIMMVDDRWYAVDAPLDKRVGAIHMFAFHEPGILSGLTPIESHLRLVPAIWCNFAMDPASARQWALAKNSKARRYGSVSSFNPVLFQRMLAKIGHSFAVAEMGIGAFIPLLPKAIIDEEPWQSNHLVGGYPDEVPPSSYTNEIGLRHRTSVDGRPFIVVQIRLFGNLGAPVYYVVVGLPVLASSTAFDTQAIKNPDDIQLEDPIRDHHLLLDRASPCRRRALSLDGPPRSLAE